MNGIFISTEALKAAPDSLRRSILNLVLADAGSADVAREVETEDGFAELSPGQVKAFLEGCSEKTKLALETIARGRSRQFKLNDVAKALKVEPVALKGVWGGLTRRTKTITGDASAYLIDWIEDEKLDQWIGELSEMTYQSFRRAFRL